MKTGLVLGFFDGVHLAHQEVIRSAINYAEKVCVITFKSSPAEFFGKDCKYIYPREKSIEKIKSLGVDEVVELDFAKIAAMPAEEYLQTLVEKYLPVSISTGFNHTFGKNRSGNAEFLEANSQKYGYKYFCIPAQMRNNKVISSTYIKELLQEGRVERANELLGSKFSISGVVIEGAQLGRTIGFPTANVKYPPDIVQIPYGVYAARVGGHAGVLNWGIKPTVHNTKEPIVEVHILDYEGDLYGKNIEIDILKKLRNEQKFASLEELKLQIKKDAEECLKL